MVLLSRSLHLLAKEKEGRSQMYWPMCVCVSYTSCLVDRSRSTVCLCKKMLSVTCPTLRVRRSSGNEPRACRQEHIHATCEHARTHTIIIFSSEPSSAIFSVRERKRLYLNKCRLQRAIRSGPELFEDVPWVPVGALTGQRIRRRVLKLREWRSE